MANENLYRFDREYFKQECKKVKWTIPTVAQHLGIEEGRMKSLIYDETSWATEEEIQKIRKAMPGIECEIAVVGGTEEKKVRRTRSKTVKLDIPVVTADQLLNLGVEELIPIVLNSKLEKAMKYKLVGELCEIAARD